MEEITVYDKAVESLRYILRLLPLKLQDVQTGIICGSGLGGLADQVASGSWIGIPYKDIPYFAQSTGMSSQAD